MMGFSMIDGRDFFGYWYYFFTNGLPIGPEEVT